MKNSRIVVTMRRLSAFAFAVAICVFGYAQELTLKGTPVSELTSQYIEVYVSELTRHDMTDIVIDAGQIIDFDGINVKRGGTDGLLLRPDGNAEKFNGPIAVLDYLYKFGGYKVIDMSIASFGPTGLGSIHRYKHYLLEKRND